MRDDQSINAAAQALQQERLEVARRAEEAVRKLADEAVKLEDLKRRYVSWLRSHEVPLNHTERTTTYVNVRRRFRTKRTPHESAVQSWYVASRMTSYDSFNEHYTFYIEWYVKVTPDGRLTFSQDLKYSNMREAIVKMVDESGIPWPYDD